MDVSVNSGLMKKGLRTPLKVLGVDVRQASS